MTLKALKERIEECGLSMDNDYHTLRFHIDYDKRHIALREIWGDEKEIILEFDPEQRDED